MITDKGDQFAQGERLPDNLDAANPYNAENPQVCEEKDQRKKCCKNSNEVDIRFEELIVLLLIAAVLIRLL